MSVIMELVQGKVKVLFLCHLADTFLIFLERFSVPQEPLSLLLAFEPEKFPIPIIGKEHPRFFKEFPNARNPVCEAFLRRNSPSKNHSSLLKGDPFGKGTHFQRSVFPVNSPAWIDIISAHKTAFFMSLEKKYFKSLGVLIPEENRGGSLSGDGNHIFP
jgi:hypothetical protein